MIKRFFAYFLGNLFYINIFLIIAITIIVYNYCLTEYSKDYFIGLATNLVGILVTINFVQNALDKQKVKDEKQKEIEKILRFSRIAYNIINYYEIYFYEITTPLSKRNKDKIIINTNFTFSDMQDIYLSSTRMCNDLHTTALENFYKYERNIRDFFISCIKEIDFKYNNDLYIVIQDFIDTSINYDAKDAVLNVLKNKIGNEKFIDVIKRMLSDFNDEITEISQHHILSPYFFLFNMLKRQIELIRKYQNYINTLKIYLKDK